MPDNEAYLLAATSRTPWNKGKLIGAKPPLRPKHVWAIRIRLMIEGRSRDLAMFNLAIDSKLRGCDVVALKVEDVAPNGYAIDRATIRQRKTGRPVKFELTSSTSSAGLPKRRAVDTYPCDALWLGPSWPWMSLDRYTQSTLNVARHAKKSEVEVEGEIESQMESQEVQEGQASCAAQAAERCCQHSGAGSGCNGSSRLRCQARSCRSGVKRRRGATSF